GVDPTILRAEGAAVDIVEPDVWIDLGDLLRGYPTRGHTEPGLQREVCSEDRLLGRIGEEEEIALLMQVDVLVDGFLESFPSANAVVGEPDVRLGRELLADAAGGVRGRAAADRVPLEHDDVRQPALRQRIGDGAAHDARADDHRVRRRLHSASPSITPA